MGIASGETYGIYGQWGDDDGFSYTNSEDEETEPPTSIPSLHPTNVPSLSPTIPPSSLPPTILVSRAPKDKDEVKSSCQEYRSSTFLLEFSYSVEIKHGDGENVINSLEKELAHELAAELLPCNFRRKNLRLLSKSQSQSQNVNMDVVAIDAHPKDRISRTRGCLPALNRSNKCYVVEGGLTISLGDNADPGQVKYVLLSRIMYYMVNGLFITHIEGLDKVSYREPSFTNPENANHGQPTTNSKIHRSDSATVPALAAFLTVLLLGSGLAFFTFERRRRMKRLMSRGEEFSDEGSDAKTEPGTPPDSPPKSPFKQNRRPIPARNQRRRKKRKSKNGEFIDRTSLELRIPSLLTSSDLSVIAEERSIDECSSAMCGNSNHGNGREDHNSTTDSCDSSSQEGDSMASIFEDVDLLEIEDDLSEATRADLFSKFSC
eukprot:CAMPEP_0172493276 /NCGR_PEP_ID=MMETSP1066-20121228/24670_1 /TAXON_ID=671091 /ORGANISM="Coscinodiscus wailesii, Strain CCMP2513" /LENGTH=432 /DNA_ID=CAMNT_0013263361 /DNA_START=197 /DNA_END=1495 /DNA_ORIENTATION=+